MPSDPVDAEHAEPQPVASLQLDAVVLPIYDLQAFNDADLRRVTSFVTNFGSWALPSDVAAALNAGDGRGALEWIHDTGELVLLGGTPTVGTVSADVPGVLADAAAGVPAFLGGEAGDATECGSGMVREYFKSELLPDGSRVALLAHVAHGPARARVAVGLAPRAAQRDVAGPGWSSGWHVSKNPITPTTSASYVVRVVVSSAENRDEHLDETRDRRWVTGAAGRVEFAD